MSWNDLDRLAMLFSDRQLVLVGLVCVFGGLLIVFRRCVTDVWLWTIGKGSKAPASLRCPTCTYSLDDLFAGRVDVTCPECGQTAIDRRMARAKKRAKIRLFAAMIVIAAGGLSLLLVSRRSEAFWAVIPDRFVVLGVRVIGFDFGANGGLNVARRLQRAWDKLGVPIDARLRMLEQMDQLGFERTWVRDQEMWLPKVIALARHEVFGVLDQKSQFGISTSDSYANWWVPAAIGGLELVPCSAGVYSWVRQGESELLQMKVVVMVDSVDDVRQPKIIELSRLEVFEAIRPRLIRQPGIERWGLTVNGGLGWANIDGVHKGMAMGVRLVVALDGRPVAQARWFSIAGVNDPRDPRGRVVPLVNIDNHLLSSAQLFDQTPFDSPRWSAWIETDDQMVLACYGSTTYWRGRVELSLAELLR